MKKKRAKGQATTDPAESDRQRRKDAIDKVLTERHRASDPDYGVGRLASVHGSRLSCVECDFTAIEQARNLPPSNPWMRFRVTKWSHDLGKTPSESRAKEVYAEHLRTSHAGPQRLDDFPARPTDLQIIASARGETSYHLNWTDDAQKRVAAWKQHCDAERKNRGY